MKKIIAILVLFFAFSFNANAQEKKTEMSKKESIIQNATKDAKDLAALVELNDETIAEYTKFFIQKHRDLSEGLSDERIEAMIPYYQSKIMGGLTVNQQSKLKENPELLKQLCSK